MSDQPKAGAEQKPATIAITSPKGEFDYSNTPKLDFIPLLANQNKGMAQFWEILEVINPDLLVELKKDPVRFNQFMEISTRNEKASNGGFDPKSYTMEVEKGLLLSVGNPAAATRASSGSIPAQRQQQVQVMQQQRQLQQRQVESQLTDSDNENITNLMNLGGFSRAKCVQAYLICDKNPELAANWLFSQME